MRRRGPEASGAGPASAAAASGPPALAPPARADRPAPRLRTGARLAAGLGRVRSGGSGQPSAAAALVPFRHSPPRRPPAAVRARNLSAPGRGRALRAVRLSFGLPACPLPPRSPGPPPPQRPRAPVTLAADSRPAGPGRPLSAVLTPPAPRVWRGRWSGCPRPTPGRRSGVGCGVSSAGAAGASVGRGASPPLPPEAFPRTESENGAQLCPQARKPRGLADTSQPGPRAE